MAEKTPIGSSHGDDVLRKKKRRPTSQDGKPVRRLKKRPLRRKPTGTAPVKDTLGIMSSARFATDQEPAAERLVRKEDNPFAKKPAPGRKMKRPPGAGLKPTGKRLLKRKKLKRKLSPEEIEVRRLAKEAKEAEAALTEEERAQLAKEAEIKRQEEEKLKQEEEERLRLEEVEKVKLEKEEEIKRIEQDKVRQEKERDMIFKKIEHYKNNLSSEEVVIAEKIASEMVKRNIKWNGYISLHSGIGGAMLRD